MPVDENNAGDFELLTAEQQERWHHDEQRELQSLPRADGGKQAWLFLTACFLFEALIWGFPFAFGVFQTYYASHEPFSSQASGIAAIGTTATGCMYFPAPLYALVLQRYPHARRLLMIVGLTILLASLIAASFCNSVGALIATQGFLYALGGLLAYFPAMQLLDDWFIMRKGVAFGIMWSGTGMAGAVVPFLMQWLLDQYGFRTALRVWAVVVTALLGPSIFFIRPRTPVPASSALRPYDFTYLAHAPFWWFATGTLLQGLGFFLPTLWIPSFANSLGLPAFSGPLALAIYNLSASFGTLSQGWLCDRVHVTVIILLATIGSMIAIFVLWGVTTSQPMLYIFVIAWGVFGGGYSATWTGCANAIRSAGHETIDTGSIIAFMAASKGIGAVISGPLSEKLLEMARWEGAKYTYGSDYGILVVFTGVSATLGGLSWIGRLLKVL